MTNPSVGVSVLVVLNWIQLVVWAFVLCASATRLGRHLRHRCEQTPHRLGLFEQQAHGLIVVAMVTNISAAACGLGQLFWQQMSIVFFWIQVVVGAALMVCFLVLQYKALNCPNGRWVVTALYAACIIACTLFIVLRLCAVALNSERLMTSSCLLAGVMLSLVFVASTYASCLLTSRLSFAPEMLRLVRRKVILLAIASLLAVVGTWANINFSYLLTDPPVHGDGAILVIAPPLASFDRTLVVVGMSVLAWGLIAWHFSHSGKASARAPSAPEHTIGLLQDDGLGTREAAPDEIRQLIAVVTPPGSRSSHLPSDRSSGQPDPIFHAHHSMPSHLLVGSHMEGLQ